MPITPVSLGLRSNADRSAESGAGRLINCYAEDMGEDALHRYPVYACDGFSSFATLTGTGNGVVRGGINFDDATLYLVTGTRINRVSSGGTATDMGALATSGYAYFARNVKSPNAQIGLVTSDGLFRIIENNSVSTPTLDGSIPSSTFNSIMEIDGYFLITCSGGDFYITSIDEGTTIDALDFASASANSDGLLRGVKRGVEAVLLGPRSTEFWRNTRAADFPFERVHAALFGCYSAASAATVSAVIDGKTVDAVIMAATNVDGAYIGVMLVPGYDATKISTEALDRKIRDETTPSSIRAFTHTRNGTTFYTIGTSTWTWEYNCRTGF